MQFIDLKAQFERLEPQIRRRIDEVLSGGHFILGPEVAEFETLLANYCGVPHAIGCANGTDALVLALRALDIGRGDAVLTTPFSFFATVEAIMLVGAKPLFADIDPVTFNIDPDKLQERIERHDRDRDGELRAVITVDLFGLPADYERIEPICAEHGLALIEDAAQGFGGAIGSKRAGSFGTIATTSFFPAKPLGSYGDGGALFTADAALAARLRSLRMHGRGEDKYDNVEVGYNSRLDTIQAAILIEKLAAFPAELEARQRIAGRYDEALPDIVTVPRVPPNMTSSWAQYSVLAEDGAHRRRLITALSDAGIPATIYYARPLHLQPALAALGHGVGEFPIAEDVSNRIFSLPMGPYLAEADQDRVIAALRAA
jgi:dTDP-4-amino-4,6-dideoxygalactose transaminase